ncbi:MAG TPA: universal stress protein [Candidatus Margulisiibacteriota bacterium]|nr:universal stress protein [Candidatus Margulisiibacteriota bacterium]
MTRPKIVLCPIDFSDLSRQELALAVEVGEAFGAHVVLHHNLAAVSPGFTRAWEWNEVHRTEAASSTKAEAKLRQLLTELPKTLSVEATVSTGPLGTVLLELARQLPADLMVLGSHGWSTDDHASVTERIIERSPCPVLTIQEGPAHHFRLCATAEGAAVPVVVPVDLSEAGSRVVDYAAELARVVPLRLHLLHVAPRGSSYLTLEAAGRRVNDLIPTDLLERAEGHVQDGDAIGEILKFSQRVDPAFMIMGEHARSFLRRFFTKDTARQLLHRAPCPVWFVPPGG